LVVVADNLRIPLREIEFRFVRASGPGGQNVNRVASKAVLRWRVLASPSISQEARERFVARFASRITAAGDLVLASDRHRERERNREDCLERLRRMLAAVAVAPARRRKTRPPRSVAERRLQDKRMRAEKKRGRRSLD
jgi:ribosome-associated protein